MTLRHILVAAVLVSVFETPISAALPETLVAAAQSIVPGFVPEPSLFAPVRKPEATLVGRFVVAAPLELAYKDRDKSYDLAVGQQVRISLRYNPKAGNVWSIVVDGAPVLKSLGIENGQQVQIISFQAAAAGSAKIELKYKGADYAFNAAFNVR